MDHERQEVTEADSLKWRAACYGGVIERMQQGVDFHTAVVAVRSLNPLTHFMT